MVIPRAALALALLGIGLIPSSASAQAPFQVREVKVSGPGCPQGSFAVLNLSDPDTQALTVLFSELSATGLPPIVRRNGRDLANPVAKRCEIVAEVIPRPGTQIALLSVETRGTVDVFGPRDTDMGLNNVVRVRRAYFFNARDSMARTRLPFRERGTRIVDSSGAYTIGEDATILTYAGCNAAVHARIVLNLVVTGDLNYGDISALDQNSAVRFDLRARACTGNEPAKDPTILPIAASRKPLKRNLCALENDVDDEDIPVGGRRGGRMKVCYDTLGRELSREPDPNL